MEIEWRNMIIFVIIYLILKCPDSASMYVFMLMVVF